MTPKTKPNFSVKVCETQDDWEIAYAVRCKVFVDEQGFSLDDEIDDYEPISKNLVLFTHDPTTQKGEQTAAGVVRLTPSIGKISRLALLPNYRSYGFGRDLMLAAEAYFRTQRSCGGLGTAANVKAARLFVHSQLQVVSFYQKLGYEPDGEQFDEDGADGKADLVIRLIYERKEDMQRRVVD